ncbi:MAG: hypothetical protein AB2L14_21530 [Candidatus Xenobiia bacterium LiM19]
MKSRSSSARIEKTVRSTLFVEPLIESNYSSSLANSIRSNGASALGEIRTRRALEPLVRALNSSDWRVKE